MGRAAFVETSCLKAGDGKGITPLPPMVVSVRKTLNTPYYDRFIGALKGLIEEELIDNGWDSFFLPFTFEKK